MTEETMPQNLPEMTELPPIGATLKAKRGRKANPKTGISGLESADGSPAKAEPVKAKPRIEQQCDEIKLGMSGLFGAVGSLVGNFDEFDGMALTTGVPPFCPGSAPFIDACVRAARQDAAMRGWLLSIVHVSAYSDIALYGAMMVVPIMMHHFPSLFSLPSLGGSNGVYPEN